MSTLPASRLTVDLEPQQGARPIVKWVGGKRKLVPELLARMPRTFLRYFEPFFGGGALFFAAKLERPSFLGDLNVDLIEAHVCVRDDLPRLLAHLKVLAAGHVLNPSEFYYSARTVWNDKRHTLPVHERAALFLYINRACWNGVFRVNRAGKLNVPIGSATEITIDEENFWAAKRALAAARLAAAPYGATIAKARRGDFIYFDPPYDPVSETADFTTYTEGGFDRAAQQALAACFRRLTAMGCYVMLSNSDTPFVRELYKGFCIETVQVGRSINSKGTGRGAVAEVLVTNDYPRRG